MIIIRNINQRSLSDLYTIITIDVIEKIRRVTVHNDTHNSKVPTSDPYEKRQKWKKINNVPHSLHRTHLKNIGK